MNTATWKEAWESAGEEFSELQAISECLDNPRNHEPRSMDVYKMYGNFRCPGKKKQKCNGSWSSTECVSQWNYWYDVNIGEGQIELIKEYQQQCRNCQSWVSPRFDEESTAKAVSKLATRIKRVFYGEAPENVTAERHSRANARKKPHDSERCEACQEGICPQDQLGFSEHRTHVQRDYTNAPRKEIRWKIKLSDNDTVTIGYQGIRIGEIDNMIPVTKEDFEKALCEKIRLFNNSEHYQGLLQSITKDLVIDMTLPTLKKVKVHVEGMHSTLLKEETSKSKPKVGKGKTSLKNSPPNSNVS